MSHSPVWRLLRRNISPSQFVGYALANFVGLAIILAAVQFYTDVNSAFTDSTLGRDYLVISREIKHIGAKSTFSPEDLDDLRSQPWVEEIGEFTPSRFESMIKVNLATGPIGTTGYDMPQKGISTDAFFESLPDRFFDHIPDGWEWQPAASGKQPRVPIVLSKDYLTLFNFGFATSFGFPTISENTVSAVPLKITISDGLYRHDLDAYIAGFSSRINTIAVPQTFMDWANSNFATSAPREGPSRLIIQTNDPGNPQARQYFADHGYEVAGDKMNSSQTAFFLRLITAIIIGVGLIISLLAFFILMLSIFLLVQKSREKLRDLILLGYTPGSIAVYYYRLIAVINAGVVILSVITVLMVRTIWTNAVTSVNATPGSILPMAIIALAVLAMLTCVNILVIRHLVARSARR